VPSKLALFFGRVFEAEFPGICFAIMDVYNDHPTPGTRPMDWIVDRDTQRSVWEELERRGRDFNFTIPRHPYASCIPSSRCI